MSVTKVTFQWDNMVASDRTDGILSVEEYSATFDVEFDGQGAPENRPILALSDARIPRLWQSHPLAEWMYVNSRSVKFDGPFHAQVTVNYVSNPEPLAQPPVFSWSHATQSEPIDRDKDGGPLVNSSGESFDPPIQKDVDDLILRVTWNRPSFDAMVASEYKGAVNNDVFLGYFEPNTVKCTIFEGSPARAAHLHYWQVTMEFQIRRDVGIPGVPFVGWERRILDQGFRKKTGTNDDGTPQYEAIVDSEGSPVSQPVLLNGSGAVLDDGDDPVYLEFEVNKTASFSSLGLDQFI